MDAVDGEERNRGFVLSFSIPAILSSPEFPTSHALSQELPILD
jgi:hypothetical protein